MSSRTGTTVRTLPWIMAAAVTIVAVRSAHATSEVPIPKTLQGVRTVLLAVTNFSGWSEVGDALTVIQPQIEAKLRQAGIRLLTDQELQHGSSAPTLEVWVRAAKASGSVAALRLSAGPDPELEATNSSYVFFVTIRLSQEIKRVAASTEPAYGVTWSWEGRLGTEQKRPFKRLRADLLSGIDDFVASWASVNETP